MQEGKQAQKAAQAAEFTFYPRSLSATSVCVEAAYTHTRAGAVVEHGAALPRHGTERSRVAGHRVPWLADTRWCLRRGFWKRRLSLWCLSSPGIENNMHRAGMLLQPQVSRGRNGSPSSAMTTSPSSEMAQLTQKSHEIQPANIPEHPSLLSRLTGFKGYIKKTYQTFLDAIPIQPKLKISLDVVTFHRKPD